MPEDPVHLRDQALAMCTALGGRLKGWSLFNPHSVGATEFYSWKGLRDVLIQFTLKTKQLKPERIHDSPKVIHLFSA